MKEYIVAQINNINFDDLFQDHKTWEKANINNDFHYPWENNLEAKTTFRALYDERNLYFRFEVTCSPVLAYVVNNAKMEVNDSDRVEIFFRKDDKLRPYYCLEMDSKGRLMDFNANYYKNFDFDWNWPSDEIIIRSEITKTGYNLCGAISLESLNQLGVLSENCIEAGLYRGHCLQLPEGNNEADFKWISWVTPNSETPDFHIPSSFGKLFLK